VEGSIVSLLQTIDHDVELEIVAVLNKYRKEKADNQVKYSKVLYVMNELIRYYEPTTRKPTFVDFVCSNVYDPSAPRPYYDHTTGRLMNQHREPIGRRIDADAVRLWFAEEEDWNEERALTEEEEAFWRELETIKIQAVFRGYMARCRVSWIRRRNMANHELRRIFDTMT
jgi:hypothetical protein